MEEIKMMQVMDEIVKTASTLTSTEDCHDCKSEDECCTKCCDCMKEPEKCDNCEATQCVFCRTETNFEDQGNYYCIDCYVKLRNSAHTHDLPVNPQPLTPISPFTYPPITIPSQPSTLPFIFIC